MRRCKLTRAASPSGVAVSSQRVTRLPSRCRFGVAALKTPKTVTAQAERGGKQGPKDPQRGPPPHRRRLIESCLTCASVTDLQPPIYRLCLYSLPLFQSPPYCLFFSRVPCISFPPSILHPQLYCAATTLPPPDPKPSPSDWLHLVPVSSWPMSRHGHTCVDCPHGPAPGSRHLAFLDVRSCWMGRIDG